MAEGKRDVDVKTVDQSAVSTVRLARAAAFLASLAANDRWDKLALSGGLRDVVFAPGRCTATLRVGHSHTNVYNTMHGGCVATIVDCVSTSAFATTSDADGVASELSVSYLRPVRPGTEVIVEATVRKSGRTAAVVTIDVSLAGSGELAATARHTISLSGQAQLLTSKL